MHRRSIIQWWIGFLLLSLILISSSAFGGSNPSEAETLLDRLQKKLSTLVTLQADFTQKFIQGKDQRVESGVLWLGRGEKMRWDYAQPQNKLFVVDGKTQYTWIPSENRVFRETLKASADQRTPILLLLGKLHWKKFFSSVTIVRELDASHGSILVLEARPKNDSMGYETVGLEVEKNTLHLRQITVDNMDRSRMVFTFSNIVENPKIDPQKFTFRIPSGAEVVDQGAIR